MNTFEIVYPDWKTLTLRQFHLAPASRGALEGRRRIINTRTFARAEKIAQAVFASAGDVAEGRFPFHLALAPDFDLERTRLPRQLFLALLTADPLTEDPDALYSYAVVAWFAHEATGSPAEMVRAHVRPFDWPAVAVDIGVNI